VGELCVKADSEHLHTVTAWTVTESSTPTSPVDQLITCQGFVLYGNADVHTQNKSHPI